MLDCPKCGESRDYIPGGKTVTEVQDVRPAVGYHRCGVPIANDIQSGPIYCGNRATLIADAVGGLVAVCKRHEISLRNLERR